nr:hypothetical protein [Tanacetum cinerariifolium]
TQIEQDEAYARELEANLNKNIDWDEKTKEQMEEEDSRAFKRLSESQEDKAAKKQKLDKEVGELRKHLQIVPNDDDDVYTKATPLALKDKGKGIMVYEPKPLKKKTQIEQDEAYARELEANLNKNIDWDETKERIEEEDSRALKRLNETPAEKAAKRQKLDKEVEELKRHLHIMPNEDDDVYIEATPLARKVPVVDYKIIELN